MRLARLCLVMLLAVPEGALAQPESSELSAASVAHDKSGSKKKAKHKKKHRPDVPVSIAPPVKTGKHKSRRPVDVQPEESTEDETEAQESATPAEEAPADSTEEPEAAAASSVEFDYQGYVRVRGTRAVTDSHALLAGVTATLPDWFGALEANIQPKLRLFDGHFTLAADVSLLGSTQAPYVSLLASEVYAQVSLFDSAYLVVGRRRVVWGTGLSWNPTDLVNPPRDLLEPARTRAGALMLPMIDVALNEVTLSAFVSAPVTYDAYGLPRAIGITTPIAGARVFTNQFGTDFAMMYFYDKGKGRHSFGATASTVVADVYELHAEGIVHLGQIDRPPMESVDACGPDLGPAPKYGGAAVIGARRDWSDRSLIGVEYLFNSGGYTPEEYALVRTELPCLRAAAKVAQLQNPTRAPTVAQPVVLVRQHYLSLLAQKPHLADEGWLEHFGVSGGAIISLSDASTILQARVDYSMGSGFVLSAVGAAFLGLGGGEVSMAPTRGLFSLDLQWSY